MAGFFIIIVAIVMLLAVFIFVINLIFGESSPKVESTKKPERPPLTDAEKEAIRQADEAWDWDTHNAIVNGKYTGKLPEHVVGGHWTQLYPDIYHTTITGINYRKGIKDLAGLTFNAMLMEEKDNEYDPNAIKIIHAGDARHLGYIPSDETDAVRKFLGRLPYPCRAHIEEEEEEDFDTSRTRHYLRGEVNIKKLETQ